jgi:hypothetical protein
VYYDKTISPVTGSFPKRLKNLTYKLYYLRLEDSFVAEIGELARRGLVNGSTEETVYLRVTNRIDWRSGDFGDGGSCFWQDRSHAKDMIENAGGGAIQRFTNDSYTNGESRCWIVPHKDGAVIFNAYGTLNLSQYAHLLSEEWDLAADSVSLCNFGHTSGILYINGDKGIYLRPKEAQSLDEIDLRIPDRSQVECSHCGEYFDDGDVVRTNGEYYCSDCHNEIFIQCRHCHQWIEREDSITSEDTGRVYCQACADHYDLRPCAACGVYRGPTRHHEPNMTEIDGQWYCLAHVPEIQEA